MSYAPESNLRRNFGNREGGIYRRNDTDPYKGADPSIGFDIDGQTFTQNGVTYGTYDEYVDPHVSGQTLIIPHDKQSGLHRKYLESRDSSGERIYNMKDFLDLNQKASMDDMIVSGNGRVGDVKLEVTDAIQKKPVDLSLIHDNSETSIKGLLDGNAVNTLFFSEMNVKVLQDALRYGVYKKTGKTIDEQSPDELYIIMRSTMLQYANFQAGASAVLSEVQRLNTKVLIYCIDVVSSNVIQHLRYLDELETLPVPIDRPAYVEHPKNLTYDISNLL
jgi:hypothetical protein